MEQILISIIVPVYMTEKFLKECLDSILKQTYSFLEIILVDDGSIDQCGVICDQYAEIDQRIKVVHKKNEGQAEARNIGLSLATGEYIGFIDSDDKVAENMFEILLDNIRRYDADIAICGRCMEFDTGKTEPMFCLPESVVMNPKEAIKRFLLSNDLDSAVWDKLFKKSLFENIKFPSGYISEDVPVIFELLSKAKRIVHVGTPLYFYRVRNGSVSHSPFNEKSMGLYHHFKYVYDKVLLMYADLKQEGQFFYYKELLYLNYLISSSGQKTEFRNMVHYEIVKNIKQIINNKYLKMKYKIFAFLSVIKLEKMLVWIISSQH